MLKKTKKCFLFWVFLISCFFVFFCCNFCLALEVKLPTLPTGETPPSGPDLPKFLLYLYYFGLWFGFGATIFSLVVAGGLYLLSNALPNLKVLAKDWLSGAIKGFVLLSLTYLIAVTINPSLRIFEIREKLKEPPPPPEKEESAGVYFYTEGGCPAPKDNKQISPATSSVADLGDLKNRVKSIRIVQKPESELYYIALLYDVINFWGKCQYIDPNEECPGVDPFAASTSIYQYSFNPVGNGVTFYRKPFYDGSGGWYTIENNKIGGIYIENLHNLRFKGVPLEEQDCTNWDIKGNCIESARKPPTLSGQNISSIKIDGSYMVLLIYFNPATDIALNGPWSFCQAFPTTDDINKEGPKQIKWEAIQNQQQLPNFVAIFPVAKK